jgi:PTH2 family peptidyl-tRNA hydrolase
MSHEIDGKELRLYAIVRSDLLPIFAREAGKLIAQTGHAYLDTLLDAQKRYPDKAQSYLATGRPKIGLKARNERELIELYEQYRHSHGAALIKDVGRTVFGGPTVTVLGIGPICRHELPKRLQALRHFPKKSLEEAIQAQI